jgi:hypothetical protein
MYTEKNNIEIEKAYLITQNTNLEQKFSEYERFYI